jgi:hypothetical protein
LTPATRSIVDRCKIDESVVLLKQIEVSTLLGAIERVPIKQQEFCTFVPKQLAVFAHLERLLT